MFKASLFYLLLPSAYNKSLFTEFNLVLTKIPTEDNLKFVFEKHKETEKIEGKKMR